MTSPIHHVHVFASDIDESMRFYGELFEVDKSSIPRELPAYFEGYGPIGVLQST